MLRRAQGEGGGEMLGDSGPMESSPGVGVLVTWIVVGAGPGPELPCWCQQSH